MPPELINEGKMSKAVDVYGFGVLLWEVLSQRKEQGFYAILLLLC